MKPRELTEKEIKKLQKQFPMNKQELERLKENKRERIKAKIDMIFLVVMLIGLVAVLYVFYLSWNYAFVGM
jgi:signal transduction histidine kinase